MTREPAEVPPTVAVPPPGSYKLIVEPMGANGFKKTGHLVFCFYRTSFPDSPARPRGFPRLDEFLRDAQEVGRGVVVRQSGWESLLASNKLAFARRWIEREEFVARYPAAMTGEQYVDALFANAGVTPTAHERASALAAFGGGGREGRARALLDIVESGSVCNKYFNPSFVMMQYFGYLRRNPDAPPDGSFGGVRRACYTERLACITTC